MSDVAMRPTIETSWLPGHVQDLIERGDWGPFYTPASVGKDREYSFIEASGDNNLIHTDDLAARQAGFDRCVAHGDLVIAMLPALLRPLFTDLQLDGVGLINHGGGEFFFKRAVYVGDSVKARVKIREPKQAPRQYRYLTGVIQLDYEYQICHADDENEKISVAVTGSKYLVCFQS